MSEAILEGDANPYSAPDAALDTGQDDLYQPKIFSFSGRIGRMRYLAYGIGVNILLMAVMIPLGGATAVMGGEAGMSMIGMLVIGIFDIATFVISNGQTVTAVPIWHLKYSRIESNLSGPHTVYLR